MAGNLGESIYSKLRTLSRERGIDMQSLLRLYAQQRLLYRISVLQRGPGFCLKGGMMIAAWNGGEMMRPTEDMDLNGDGHGSVEDVCSAISEAVAADVPEDGARFDASGMKAVKDREGVIPGGKVVLDGSVHTARVRVRVDVGFGNEIVPAAEPMEIPTLLPDVVPRPVIRGYPLETILSEKLHAVAQFGDDNTRHKDFYDLWRISRLHEIGGATLAAAVRATFAQQGRERDPDMPGLGAGFARENERAWQAFLRKSSLADAPSLEEVSEEIRQFLQPALDGSCAEMDWTPGRGWEAPAPAPSMR